MFTTDGNDYDGWKQTKMVDMSMAQFVNEWRSNFYSNNPPGRLNVFTMVREPFSHFISGVREHLERTPMGLKSHMYTDAEIRGLIVDMVNATWPSSKQFSKHMGSSIKHVKPQVSWFSPIGEGILVGRLENFYNHIENIAYRFGVPALLGILTNTSKEEEGHHKSSDDPHGAGAALSNVLAKETDVKRALCWLLLPDFICFNYPLPEECGGIGLEP